jgi:hypothetical protein
MPVELNFHITSDNRYAIKNLQVDGKIIDDAYLQQTYDYTLQDHYGSYFGHNVRVEFIKIDKVTVTANAYNGGKIDPEGERVVDSFSDQEFTITPDNQPFNRYQIDNVALDGKDITDKVEVDPLTRVGKYKFNVGLKDHGLTVTFKLWDQICPANYHIDLKEDICVPNVQPGPVNALKISQVNKMKDTEGTDLHITWTISTDLNNNADPIKKYTLKLYNVFKTQLIAKTDLDPEAPIKNFTCADVGNAATERCELVYPSANIGRFTVEVTAKSQSGVESPIATAYTLVKLGKNIVNSFSDISHLNKGASKARYKDILWLAQTEVTTGSPCGRKLCYNPNNPVNRGAMADFMYKLNGQTTIGDTKTQVKWFSKEKVMSDKKTGFVTIANGRYQHILWLAKEGITKGCSFTAKLVPSAYCPAAWVNRGAMAEFMYHLAGDPGSLNPQSKDSDHPNDNHQATSELKKYESEVSKDSALKKLKIANPNRYWDVLWLVKYNITLPSAGKYNPLGAVTRGAMAQFMRKLYYVMLTGKTVPANGIVPEDSSIK